MHTPLAGMGRPSFGLGKGFPANSQQAGKDERASETSSQSFTRSLPFGGSNPLQLRLGPKAFSSGPSALRFVRRGISS